jgi:hypothetical protein
MSTPDATPMAPPKDELEATIDRVIDKATAQTREVIAVAEQALAQRDELAACLREVLKGFETGVFVRNIEGDGQPDWAIKLIPFVALLGRCQAALASIPDQKEEA